MYLNSSEFVSVGHPDRVCDVLASLIIQDIQSRDRLSSHAAIEVFLTHDSVIFGGEATTTLKIDKKYLKSVLVRGFDLCGYLPQMRKYWTKKEVVLANDLKIINKIEKQSPDIALGTTNKAYNSGWNDQGIMYSSSDNTNSLGLGTPMYCAQLISDALLTYSRVSILENLPIKFGPDNKVVVTVNTKNDGYTPISISSITIAQSHDSKSSFEDIQAKVKSIVSQALTGIISIDEDCSWIINGTGRFVVHGCVSDCSTTGRKISVNHPSAGPLWCNKMIGGGSLVKPWHASDFILNVASRYIANCIVKSGLSKYAVVGCACGIGQHSLQSLFIKGDYTFEHLSIKNEVVKYFQQSIDCTPIGLARFFGLFQPSFSFVDVVKDNFFGNPATQPWETPKEDHLEFLKNLKF